MKRFCVFLYRHSVLLFIESKRNSAFTPTVMTKESTVDANMISFHYIRTDKCKALQARLLENLRQPNQTVGTVSEAVNNLQAFYKAAGGFTGGGGGNFWTWISCI